MERLTPQQLKVLLEFVRGFYACHDRDAYISYLLYGISTLIPAELTAIIDINNHGRIVEIRMKPSAATYPNFPQHFEHYLPQHPHLIYYQQTGDASAVTLSDLLTQRQFHALEVYRELYRPMRVEYVMNMVLSGHRPGLIVIALHRSRRDFSEQDRLVLNLLRSHLVQAYANAEAVRVMRQEIGLLGQAIEARGQGMVFLTKDGRVQLIAGGARQWLMEYFGRPSQRADGLPAAVRSWLRHQEASLEVADEALLPRKPLIVKRAARNLIVRHLCEADRCVLLMEEVCQSRQPLSRELLGLTRREADVLLWVAQGKTNAEIGEILSLSSRTVQKHLEHIFKKFGVETRIAAAQILATGAPP